MTHDHQSLEVRPRVLRNAILTGIGCAIFSVAGLWMILSGEQILVGLLSLAFFGGGGLYASVGANELRLRVAAFLGGHR